MFDSYQTEVYIALLSLAVLTIIQMFCRPKRRSGLPPGPWGPPLIGNLCQLTGDKREVFSKFRDKFGDIFSLRLGKQLAVVFNGYESIQEAFVENGESTSGRRTPFFYEHISDGGKGLFWSCGDRWRNSKKFADEALDYFKETSRMLSCIQEEITLFVKELKTQQADPIDTHTLIYSATTNICISLLVGRRFDYGSENLTRIVNIVDEFTTSSQTLMNLCPVLRHLPGDVTTFKDSINKQQYLLALLWQEIERHRKIIDGPVTNLIEYYNQNTKNQHLDILEGDLPYILRDLLLAGGNTTAILLYWGLLYLVNHPVVIENLRREQQKVAGSKPSLTPQDKPNLPYTVATCMEMLRMGCITPFSVPHMATSEIDVGGYRIPEGAILIPNIHSVLSDKNIWEDPDCFRPERFLDEAGRVREREELLPYFVGPRSCSGADMAEMELFLFLSTIIREFEILPPEPDTPPPVKGTLHKTFNADRYKIKLVPKPTLGM